MRSKPASQSSPASGAATSSGSVEIELEQSRQRITAWAIGGTIAGILLIWKLGTVAVWAGYVLVAIGLYRSYQLVQSFVHPPGTIAISDKEVVLPRGIHHTNPLKVDPKAITAVYFLRRSVPWNRSAPVLIVELGDKAIAYPRDWFASEADQRQVVHALMKKLGTEPPPADVPADAN